MYKKNASMIICTTNQSDNVNLLDGGQMKRLGERKNLAYFYVVSDFRKEWEVY